MFSVRAAESLVVPLFALFPGWTKAPAADDDSSGRTQGCRRKRPPSCGVVTATKQLQIHHKSNL